MLAVISNCWALLFGMALIMLGNGLEATLLGVRGSMEGFGTTVIGLVMSCYYLGLIIGCVFVPKMIGRVGHIRTFGALASLASTSILLQAILDEDAEVIHTSLEELINDLENPDDTSSTED